MKITNVNGLPEAIVRAVQNDPYNRGDCDYSVTQLLKPARVVALERIHRDDIEEDVSDRIWALMGQLGHAVLERSGTGMVEKRLFATRNGIRISGQLDLVGEYEKTPDGSRRYLKSTDYKFTSAWSCKDGPKPEWEQQLNLGLLLCIENEINVDALEIVAIYRDWSKMDARRSSDYPQRQAQVFRIPVWPLDKSLAFLDARIAAHEAAKQQLPECSPEERWEKPTVYAVMKEGRKSAVRLHDNEEQARLHAEQQGNGHSVVTRQGQSTRCEAYCAVSGWCQQYQSTKQQEAA